MTYQPSVYREQGGNTLVIASSGKISMESGSTMTIASGAGATLAATLTVASGGAISVASGGSISFATGGYVAGYTETVATSATALTAAGLSIVTGTTVGPTFLIANPITGVAKYISLAAASSGVTHRAIIAPASTGVSFDTTGANQITLSTSAIRACVLYGASTTAYKLVGCYVNTELGLGNVTT